MRHGFSPEFRIKISKVPGLPTQHIGSLQHGTNISLVKLCSVLNTFIKSQGIIAANAGVCICTIFCNHDGDVYKRQGTADWFGVATVPEALELRDAGVTLPIMKLSPAVTAGEREAAVASDITLTVVDADTIDAAELAARKAGRTASVHLKVCLLYTSRCV